MLFCRQALGSHGARNFAIFEGIAPAIPIEPPFLLSQVPSGKFRCWRLACFDFEKNTIRSMGGRNVANLKDESRISDTSGTRIDMML
jgi:hypothetical protein